MIEVITISNRRPSEEYYTFDQFHASLDRFGFKATVLAQGCDWTGLMGKPKFLREYLRSGRCKADVISVNDSWDSIWQKSPEQAERDFLEVGVDMFIGSEIACFPDQKLAKHHPECRSRFRFVNTGMIIGKTKAVLSMLEAMNLDEIPNDHRVDGKEVHENDQDHIMHAYLDGKCGNCLLDTETKFVVNLCGVKDADLDWDEGLIKVKETDNSPFVLHLNGGAKTDGLREKIISKLRL